MIIFSSVSLDLYGNYDRLCVKLHANARKFLILMANSTHSLQQLQYQEILWCFMMQQQERLLLGATVHLIVHNSRALIIKSHKLCVLRYYTTAAFCCSCLTLFGSIAVGLCNCSSSSWIHVLVRDCNAVSFFPFSCHFTQCKITLAQWPFSRWCRVAAVGL